MKIKAFIRDYPCTIQMSMVGSMFLLPILVVFMTGCFADPIKTVDSGNPKVTAALIANIKNDDTVMEIYRMRDGDNASFYVAVQNKVVVQTVTNAKSKIVVLQKTLEKNDEPKKPTKMEDVTKVYVYTKDGKITEINEPSAVTIE